MPANSFATLNSQLFVGDSVARIRQRIFGRARIPICIRNCIAATAVHSAFWPGDSASRDGCLLLKDASFHYESFSTGIFKGRVVDIAMHGCMSKS